jgi:hypothetical protein
LLMAWTVTYHTVMVDTWKITVNKIIKFLPVLYILMLMFNKSI